MSDRLGPIPLEDMSAAQRAAAQEIIDGPRGAVVGPFVPLLRSPELMGLAQRMGEYLRYRSAIGIRLSELAILVTARQWDQQVEWAIHAPIAEKMGIPAVVHDFCVELHETKAVSDGVYADALAQFGEQGVVDLMGINGYYTFLAMVMNTARTAVPEGDGWVLPE